MASVRVRLIDEENAVEMVDLVLENNRREIFYFQDDFLSVTVERANFHNLMSGHIAPDPRNREASFFNVVSLADRARRDLWVHVRLWSTAIVHDDDAFVRANLWRRDTDAILNTHRVQEIVDECLGFLASKLVTRDGFRFLAQDVAWIFEDRSIHTHKPRHCEGAKRPKQSFH